MNKELTKKELLIAINNKKHEQSKKECGDASLHLKEVLEKHLKPQPPQKESDYQGLKVKYRVTKVKDGSIVEDCFVLRPQIDKAAVKALEAYANSTENEELANDIKNWIKPYQPPQTQGDKIRKMSNEGLAEKLYSFKKDFCNNCTIKEYIKCGGKGCMEKIVKFLNSEVKEDE